MSGRTTKTSAADGACKVVTMQIAINGQSLQPSGAESSAQHGWSADIEVASPDMVVMAIDTDAPALARAESGAITRPTTKKTASSRQR